MSDKNSEIKWNRWYLVVFLLGIFFILALGLFTWLFNNPA